MTNDFKIDLLNYITGNIEPTNPTNEEIFKEQNNIDRDKWINFIPETWGAFRYEGMVAPNELTSNLTVLYGGYYLDGNSYGVVTLVDENFEPIKTIYEFSSGTPLRYIQYMKQAEDGTFYYIDDEVYTYSYGQYSRNSQKRFVMVNNFTLINQITNDYQINLRTSYIFGSEYQNFYCKNMFKDPNSAHYIFFGNGANDSNYDFTILKIIDLKINVGEANEWTLFANDGNEVFGSAIALFDNDSNVQYRCLVTNNLPNNNNLNCYSKTYTGNPISETVITFSEYKPYIDDANYKKQSVFLNYNEVYFVLNNQRWGSGEEKPKYIGLYRFNFVNSNLMTIFEKYLGDYSYSNLEAIYIDRCNTDIYVQYNTNISNNATADYYFQRLTDDAWNPILIAEQEIFAFQRRNIFVKNNFNLLSIFLYQTTPLSNWFVFQIKENYNALNYNGELYTNYNSLIPKQGEIYSDNKLVFARNLYNKTLNENSTVSTIQVPNSYLNNIDLNTKTLISETNTILINDPNVIQKNIYETLFLNYINTLNVIDEDTNEIYKDAGSYINNNINAGTDINYNNSFIAKIRINFQDNSIKIQKIFWQQIDSTHKKTAFSIYAKDYINSIDFISNDENTIYITKNMNDFNLEIGKYYTITQFLRIE
jgi:hypothetical protein